MTSAESVEACMKQAEAAGMRVAIVEVEHLRALLAEREELAKELASYRSAPHPDDAYMQGCADAKREADEEWGPLRELLLRGVDDDPCDVDHNGLCQTHWLSPAPCRNAEARRLLGLDVR